MPPEPLLPVSANLLGLFGAMSAVIYAAGLAIAIQAVHRRSEDALRVGEERYRLLAENASDMITRHDERGRVLFASHASQQLLGEAAGEAHRRWAVRARPYRRPPGLSHGAFTVQRHRRPITVEFRLRQQTQSGGSGIAGSRCAAGRCEHRTGARSPACLPARGDISERKAQEEELTRARDEAESASRAKTQFLASMSHELRTPLNAVIGFSEILNRELFGALGEQRYRDYARMIHESGEHLLHVVNDILDMSKIEAGKFKLLKEPFDVSSLVSSCADVMRHAAEAKQLTLIAEVPSGLPELVADKRACKQMLLNVISNAIKFTDAGGLVRISAREADGMIELIVADNGIGISEHDLPKLGHPFVQADNAYNRSHDGAGLGLSVVQGLARLHEGRLEIASKLGQGTTATIVLPVKLPQGERDKRSPQDPAVTAA